MKKKIDVIESSGNVFADLNIANPEEALAKAELAKKISTLIKDKHLTQAQAAAALGLDQPKVSALVNGKLTGFSLERLFSFLNELGQDITISIKPKELSRKKGYLAVNIESLCERALGKAR